VTSVTQTFLLAASGTLRCGALEKNFTSSSFPFATPGLRRCEGQLTKGPTEKSRNKEPDYDALLHRRKGSSGTEFAGVGLQFAINASL
jgi:hypothetical protein